MSRPEGRDRCWPRGTTLLGDRSVSRPAALSKRGPDLLGAVAAPFSRRLGGDVHDVLAPGFHRLRIALAARAATRPRRRFSAPSRLAQRPAPDIVRADARTRGALDPGVERRSRPNPLRARCLEWSTWRSGTR